MRTVLFKIVKQTKRLHAYNYNTENKKVIEGRNIQEGTPLQSLVLLDKEVFFL